MRVLRASQRRPLGNNAQHKMCLAFVNSDRDTPPKTNGTSSYYPSLLHIIHDISSVGPVVGQCDRNVGWPHGQHYSAREEEAVITRLTFPTAIWQQVRTLLRFIICAGLHLWFQIFLLKLFDLGLMTYHLGIFIYLFIFLLFCGCCSEGSMVISLSWRSLLSDQVSSESESGKHQS